MTESTCDVKRMVPHRPPILCVDRVVEVNDRGAATERAGGRAAEGETVWEGTLVEGLTQTAAVLFNYLVERGGHHVEKGVLVGIRRLKIHRPVGASECLRFRVELVKKLYPLFLVRCEASCGAEVVVRGEMKFHAEAAP